MKKRTALLTLVSVFSLSAMVVTSMSAQGRIVGVTEGNWFKYGDITVNWSSNDPNATFPPPFTLPFLPPDHEWLGEINETEWVLLSVEDISGTNITFEATARFKNGTERIFDGYVDIDTGDGNMTFLAISGNLDVNDAIYTSGMYSAWKINEKVVRTYPDGARETNHLNMTQEFSWPSEIDFYFSINLYWDRSTGILVETSGEGTYQMGGYVTTWSAFGRITDSNRWIIPEFPTSMLILLILIVFTVAITIYKRRLLKKPVHKTGVFLPFYDSQ